MSHTRHRWTALVGTLAACALLSGCFGGDDTTPASTQPTRHHRPESSAPATESTAPSEPTSSAPTTEPPATSVLRFSPKSGGKHTEDCQRLVPGDDPAEFLYFPVLVRASTAVDLDSVVTTHSTGVTDAGAWVAPATSSPQTGTFKGWPPSKLVTQSSQLQWSKRVPAAGATLQPGAWYNVFLRLQVDPTPGDSTADGLALSYHDAGGDHTDTWKATTTFSMSC
ncbi:MAG TPA: hypothetical protein VFJ89_03005 [Nocardioides sp.]|jgi:hypothetical protein|nr:hypothetical protein [Nocardioides sp.]